VPAGPPYQRLVRKHRVKARLVRAPTTTAPWTFGSAPQLLNLMSADRPRVEAAGIRVEFADAVLSVERHRVRHLRRGPRPLGGPSFGSGLSRPVIFVRSIVPLNWLAESCWTEFDAGQNPWHVNGIGRIGRGSARAFVLRQLGEVERHPRVRA